MCMYAITSGVGLYPVAYDTLQQCFFKPTTQKCCTNSVFTPLLYPLLTAVQLGKTPVGLSSTCHANSLAFASLKPAFRPRFQ